MKREYWNIILIATILAVGLTACSPIRTARIDSAKGSEKNSEQVQKNGKKTSGQSEDAGGKGASNQTDPQRDTENDPEKDGSDGQTTREPGQESLINGAGNTLEARFHAPAGFKRTKAASGSLTAFLRGYELKADGSPVLLYDGNEKGNQSVHAAVFKLPIEAEDLQQCADTIMRVYGEYYYSKGEYDKIRFPMGGGFTANFGKWSGGYGIGVNGDDLYWSENSKNDESYASFQKFMRIVFAYSGTLDMAENSKPVALEDIRVGDIFIKGGSPGHVVMVVDICESENGEKAVLLGQGYMPAQEFHVLKNPLHPQDPWYYQNEITYPLDTGEYTFQKKCLKRLDWIR